MSETCAAALVAVIVLSMASCATPPSASESGGGSLAFVLKEKTPAPTAGLYAGSAACRRCHEGVYSFWLQTRHAVSMDSLRAAGREQEPSCLRCHATGYGLEGGYGRGGESKGRSHVGCESCHGPSAVHAGSDDPSERLPFLDSSCPPCEIHRACRECHTAAWSPRFEMGDMLEKVACRDITEGN